MPPKKADSANKLTAADNKEPDFDDIDEIVTFLIGPTSNPKKFLVHKSFVCYHSPVLRAAFNGKFKEGETQTYTLDDVTALTFRLFVKWLYTQDLAAGKIRNNYDGSLIRLWMLADKFLIPRLQNMEVDALLEDGSSSQAIATTDFQYVYANTTVDSRLRKVLVHKFLWYSTSADFKNEARRFPQEMLIDIAIASREAVMCEDGMPSIDHALYV